MTQILGALDPVTLGFLGSLAAGLMTAVGAVPVLFGRTIGDLGRDAMLGFAAGVMLSASYFSLILPALEAAGGDGFRPAGVVSLGLLFGVATVAGVNERLPHEHFLKGREGPASERVARVWLFVFAITIHNVPEGMAVGIGFASGSLASGLALAIGIGLQNAPEGLAVALALRSGVTAGAGPSRSPG
jgi:zinc transporter, ZIP family